MIESIFGQDVKRQGLAKEYFDAATLEKLETYRLASGHLGGKATGLLLAWQILNQKLPEDLGALIHLPVSYFIGSNEFDRFLENNELGDYLDINQKLLDNLQNSFHELELEFMVSNLSNTLSERLTKMLEKIGEQPIIVRSSSVLEDQYGSAFAGIYRSVFCANQGDLENRTRQVEKAIKQVYASVFSPDAISYRNQMVMSEVPEKMAVLIQVVEGQSFNNYFFPTCAGIAFSQNPYCWTERLNPEDGFVRMVWGFGTQAVKPAGDGYPRMVGLTNPHLRPERSGKEFYAYSQRHLDVLDLEDEQFKTLPVIELLHGSYPALKYVASILDGDNLRRLLTTPRAKDQLILTFDRLIGQTTFIDLITQSLNILAEKIGHLINIEFSANVNEEGKVQVGLLQCRQLAWDVGDDVFEEPVDAHIVFTTDRFIYNGEVADIDHIVYIDPSVYAQSSSNQQEALPRWIAEINQEMTNQGYLLIGPGRLGSIRPDLGVPVRFSDIFNARALLEIHDVRGDLFSVTYGTHFFMDLVEMDIALLALEQNTGDGFIDLDYFNYWENVIDHYLPRIKFDRDLIKVFQLPGKTKLKIIASLSQKKAWGYLEDT